MRRVTFASIVTSLAFAAAPAFAQDSNFALASQTEAGRVPAGWVFTPSLLYQGAWDDNVLLRSNGDQAPGDFLSLLDPRADISFFGKRGQFDTSYDGAFSMFRELNTLNSYDQHMTTRARRLLTPHLTLFVQNAFVALPTTELVNLVAVPFVRSGIKLDDLHGGVEAALTKYTSVTAAYNFQWATFDQTALYPTLVGGHSQGGSVAVKHAVTDTLSITGTYSLQHAFIANGGTFDIQNGDAGIERKLSEQTRFLAAFGFSRLGLSEFGPARVGPSWRAGFTHQFQAATVDASYSRSWVPAFGFGGTYQNEEFNAHLRAPLAPRIYVQTLMAWRRNEPLTIGALRLKSFWVEGTLGYAVQPWARLEAFYSGDHQVVDRPGGIYSRNRIGFQIVTTKPLRVR